MTTLNAYYYYFFCGVLTVGEEDTKDSLFLDIRVVVKAKTMDAFIEDDEEEAKDAELKVITLNNNMIVSDLINKYFVVKEGVLDDSRVVGTYFDTNVRLIISVDRRVSTIENKAVEEEIKCTETAALYCMYLFISRTSNIPLSKLGETEKCTFRDCVV